MKKLLYIFTMSLILLGLVITDFILDSTAPKVNFGVVYICLVSFSIFPALYFIVDYIKKNIEKFVFNFLSYLIIFNISILVLLSIVFSPVIRVYYYYTEIRRLIN